MGSVQHDMCASLAWTSWTSERCTGRSLTIMWEVINPVCPPIHRPSFLDSVKIGHWLCYTSREYRGLDSQFPPTAVLSVLPCPVESMLVSIIGVLSVNQPVRQSGRQTVGRQAGASPAATWTLHNICCKEFFRIMPLVWKHVKLAFWLHQRRYYIFSDCT